MALGSRYVEYHKKDGVAWLRLDRPDARNAFTREMYMAIVRACREGDEDPEVRLTVITGTGDVFSAGGDLKGRYSEDPDVEFTDVHTTRIVGPGALLEVDPFLVVQRSKKLVVAVVNGIAQAGGFIMSMVADITIASDRATFRVPELLRGVADPWLASWLPVYVGMERAKNIMFTCRKFNALQAQQWGLVSEVFPHDQLEEGVQSVLDRVLLTGPEAAACYKAAANRLLRDPDYDNAGRSQASDEAREGFAAFSERRSPAWVPAARATALGRL
jgi:enoyl-CoA hydratase/carnithine racemase